MKSKNKKVCLTVGLPGHSLERNPETNHLYCPECEKNRKLVREQLRRMKADPRNNEGEAQS